MTPPSRLSFARTDTLALAAGTLLLVDLLRVWLPSIITIFGQAASTPAELMGAFALVWFVAAFAAVPLARRLPLVAVGAAGLAAARLALVVVHGGQPQLYVASLGLLAGLVWLAATAVRGGPASPGVPIGLAAAALQHAALSTVDLSWQAWWWAGPLVLAEAGVFLWYQLRPAPEPVHGGGWLLVGPAVLLTGMFVLSPPMATIAVSAHKNNVVEQPLPFLPQLVLGLAVFVFLVPVLRAPGAHARWRGWWAACFLVLSTALFVWPISFTPSWTGRIVGPVMGALVLGIAFSVSRRPSPRPEGHAAVGGMVIFAVGAVAYYAAYDIGYPNWWVPLAVALVPVWILVRPPSWPEPPGPDALPAFGAALAVCLLVPLVGVSFRPSVQPVEEAGRELRLTAYNIRMGFGLDGTFRPAETAAAITRERPDVVVLSEVDRAWLLNGGHDDLHVLARKLGMRYTFAPAADAVWGDAVLTNLPVRRSESVRLSAVGAPTGAQALGVVVVFGGREIAVVSTHIQPPPDAEPLVQVREIAAFATRFGGDRPTLIAGDLNIEPGSPSMRAFADAGYVDGFAAFRPVRTFPADAPVKEIDHVLVRGLTCSNVVVGTAVTSDHAPVSAVLSAAV
ncbi:endonuclease/exonuclease/phosphatase family protein [Dactylosporangium fulvum]|uniref:Endonuclease/exonuclease/phosphatase family protein n=1 Tax=Dactylosporangium fulvum TaxID=53359 RepID=A0ABY5VVE1_9ACTN|nr:endonuclease/exonuclease/phosphatase family protein [Dactylosporangium fulvum]UWP81114.1 endonuclease/exonuclease/phosphatase family protein [Dactylosporangium fulvum]